MTAIIIKVLNLLSSFTWVQVTSENTNSSTDFSRGVFRNLSKI